MRLMVTMAVLLVGCGVAAAQTLELSGPYGNAEGCKLVKGETTVTDQALVLKPDRIEANASACEFIQVIVAKSGTRVVTALCDIEGEEGRSVSDFSIAPSKTDPATLVIRDEYGALWDEVKPCQ